MTLKHTHLYGFMLLFLLIGFTSCRKCKNGESKENRDIPANIKNTIFSFPQNTRWVLKSNAGDMDTIYLSALIYTYNDGVCADADCCTKLYTQTISQKLTYILDADGLDKFTKFYYSDTHWLVGDYYSFAFSTYQNFSTKYKGTLVVNGRTLNDVESNTQLGPNKGDIYPDVTYWSLSKGLVRYDYQKADGSFIIYERQDL